MPLEGYVPFSGIKDWQQALVNSKVKSTNAPVTVEMQTVIQARYAKPINKDGS